MIDSYVFCKKTSSPALDFISLKTSTVTFNPQNQIVNTVGKNGVSRIEDPKLFLSFMSVFIVKFSGYVKL